VLKVRKQSYRHGSKLSEYEVSILKNAYGRFAQSTCPPEGDAFTQQLKLTGRWLACDCRVVDGRPPLLFPVSGGGIQREDRGYGVEHAETCAFARDADSQKELVGS